MPIRDVAAAANVQTPSAARAAVNVVRRPGASERDPRRNRKRRLLELTLGFLFPILLIALWQTASVRGWVNRTQIPAPSDIWSGRNRRGSWWPDIRTSVRRMMWGYFWGVLSGIVFGVTMGMSRLIRATLEPTLNVLYTVPKLAMIGVFLFVFGFDDTPIIAVVTVTVFFFVWIQTQAAVAFVPDSYREAAKSFGANRWQLFRHVVFPSALPQIFVGLRIAAGVAVLTLVGAEFVFSPGNEGVGRRIQSARELYQPIQAYAGLVVAGLIGVVFTTVVKWLARIATPWAKGSDTIA